MFTSYIVYFGISCLWLVSRPPKCKCFLGKFTVDEVLKLFSGRNNSLKLPVFGFCDRRRIKRVESFDKMGFGVIDIQQCQIFLLKFFFLFFSCHYGFTNCFKIINFVFSNIIPGRGATCIKH